MPDDDVETLYRRYLSALVLFHQAAADRADLPGTDYQASNLLDLDGPMTSGELARRLHLSTGATTRCVDRLIAAGIARRTVDPADRRRAVVEHTGHLPPGLEEQLASVRGPIGAALASMSSEQLDGFRSYLRAAAEAYRDGSTDAPG